MRAVVLRVSDMPHDSMVRISSDCDALRVQIDADSITESDALLLERRLNGDCLRSSPADTLGRQTLPHTG
jgi:hypothetical protein